MDKKDIIRKRIFNGEYSLRLSRQKYEEHIFGTPQYINTAKMRGREPSRLLISFEDAQYLINTYSGSGVPKISKNGQVMDVEYITVNSVIGEVFCDSHWNRTGRFAIYHSKNYSHIVPVEDRES